MKKLLFFVILFSQFAVGQVKHKPQHDVPKVVNEYTEVLAFDMCTNEVTVADATLYNAGDTVMMIQMKGALIDTSNTAAFGTVLDYRNAGNYEMNFISAKTGNIITLKNKLMRQYDIPWGVVQLIRVPYFKTTNYIGEFTCPSWNGKTGGVLVLNAETITLGDDIEVSGKGFRRGEVGGVSYTNCFENNYVLPGANTNSVLKGESIASVSQNLVKGKASLASGGGAGLSIKSGGGGGANAGNGGFGGYQTDTCGSAPFDNRGMGGKSIAYSTATNKIFMGGGAGAGHAQDIGIPTPLEGTGGGIAVIIADKITSATNKIISNGFAGITCSVANCNEGMTGGGGGGTVLLYVNQILDDLAVEVKGGRGASISAPVTPGAGGRAGPGGGGGGGLFFLNRSSLPANVTSDNSGGLNGVIYTDGNNAWGATAGADGTVLFDMPDPYDNIPFKPNIDSVRMQHTVNYCNNVQFNGLAYTNTFAVAGWQWNFGDGRTDNIQNPVHNYNAAGNYDVKLVVTDINGCKDSIIININTAGTMTVDAGADNALCADGFVSVTLNGSGTGNGYSWSPLAVLNNSTIPNPVATIDATTKFYLTVSNGTGCSKVDSVTITINKNPAVKTLKDTAICLNAPLTLTTTGALNYTWSPAMYVNDASIASPQYIAPAPQTLYVSGTDANGCIGKDTIHVDVKTRTTFIAPESKTTCRGSSVQLTGVNGNAFQYTWSPSLYLSDPLIENPVANPPVTTPYMLNVYDNICKNDSNFLVTVTVLPLPFVTATKSNDLNCNKPFAQLNASGATTYTWLPAYALSNDSIANPIANPAVTTTYYVYGKDSTICAGIDSVTVTADFKNHGIVLPNSFTPNNDGLNDCFGIKYYRDVQYLQFIIFNRYGIAVFKTSNANDCWDGNYKGKPAGAGTYVYSIRGKTLCGYVEIKDNFLLLR